MVRYLHCIHYYNISNHKPLLQTCVLYIEICHAPLCCTYFLVVVGGATIVHIHCHIRTDKYEDYCEERYCIVYTHCTPPTYELLCDVVLEKSTICIPKKKHFL